MSKLLFRKQDSIILPSENIRNTHENALTREFTLPAILTCINYRGYLSLTYLLD